MKTQREIEDLNQDIQFQIVLLEAANMKIDGILRELKFKNDIETKTFTILTKFLADNKVKIETLSKQIELLEYDKPKVTLL